MTKNLFEILGRILLVIRRRIIILCITTTVVAILVCLVRLFYYQQLVIETPVVEVYSINHRYVGLHDYQLFRVIGRGKGNFILMMYLKNHLLDNVESARDLESMKFKRGSSYSYFEGVWKTDFFVFCSKQHTCIFISDQPDVDKLQINHIEIKNDGNNSKRIRWIVSPVGHDRYTTKINPNIMCSIITGIDESGNHSYQLMAGVDW
jgi:hypothetical protein